MEFGLQTITEYFNYDLEKIIDEFNHFYSAHQQTLTPHFQSLYLYFSHLAENSIQLLINSNYNVNHALDIDYVPSIYIKPYSKEEINQFLINNNI